MNIILNPNQDGTKRGDIQLPAAMNLTGYDGYLVKVTNYNGAAGFTLPTSASDPAYFILAQGDVAGNTVSGETPNLDDQCRLQCTGTVAPGGWLAQNTGAYGTVFTPAAASGATNVDWVAEEAAVGTIAAPVLVKARRIPTRSVTF